MENQRDLAEQTVSLDSSDARKTENSSVRLGEDTNLGNGSELVEGVRLQIVANVRTRASVYRR